MSQINEKAKFWSRLVSALIDIILFCVVAISTSLICIKKELVTSINVEMYLVKNDYTYFLWLFILILLLSLLYILIPLICNGRTLGMMILRLKLNYNNQRKYYVILKRTELGVFLWIFVIVIFMCFVWPTTINKMIISNYIQSHPNDFSQLTNAELESLILQYQWTTLEISFYAIPSVLSPIIVLIQVFSFMSILFKQKRLSLVDRVTNSEIVYSYKYINIATKEEIEIEPEKNVIYPIIWKD